MKKFALLSILLFHLPTIACECYVLPDIRKSLDDYSLIFRGTVTKVMEQDRDAVALFEVLKVYKGKTKKQIPVNFDHVSSCMMSFSPGEEWIIYAKEDKFKRNNVDLCEHSRKNMGSDPARDHYFTGRMMSFQSEDSLLATLLQSEDFTETEEKMKERELQHPERGTAIWYILAAIPAFALILYLLKKLL